MLAATLVLGVAAVPTARAGDASQPCDWPMFGHDAGRSFAAPEQCTAISSLNAPTLAPKWHFHAPDAVSASPAIVNGRVYVGDWAGNFSALDAETGAVDWTYHVDDSSHIGFGRIVSSAAYSPLGPDGIVVFAGGATLYARNAKTGDPINSVCVDSRPVAGAGRCHDPHGTEVEIESSPAVVTEKDGSTSVLVGMDVHNTENGGRAGVIKFSLTAAGLTPLWKFDPDADAPYSDPTMLTDGAADPNNAGSGCADVWGSPAVDVDTGRVFFGTGSCDHEPAADDVGEHVWAVDLGDGHELWKYGPHSDKSAMVDDDFGGALNLLPGGRVGAGSKDGWYYAFDEAGTNPQTGVVEPVWATHVGQYGHASDGFAVGGVLASPATGKVNDKDAVFIATAISTPNDTPVSDGPDTAPPTVLEDPQRMVSLHALDAETGQILWRSYVSRQAYGPPTYVNGVVLVPSTFDFSLVAVDANTGLTLAQRPLPGPPSSAPTAVGDTVYGGIGTSTGEGSPLAPLSGVYAFRVAVPSP